METLAPTLRAKDQEIQNLRADVAELVASLDDMKALVTGDISETAQVAGVLREACAILAKHGA